MVDYSLTMRIGALVATSLPQRRIHHSGFPPQLGGAGSPRRTLPAARFLTIELTAEGFFLFRFAEDGAFAGDTWHRSLDEAKDQANYEYGNALGGWLDIPDDASDAIGWLRAQES
jgi:hypothetical protein